MLKIITSLVMLRLRLLYVFKHRDCQSPKKYTACPALVLWPCIAAITVATNDDQDGLYLRRLRLPGITHKLLHLLGRLHRKEGTKPARMDGGIVCVCMHHFTHRAQALHHHS